MAADPLDLERLAPLITMTEQQFQSIDRDPPAHLLGWWAMAIRGLHAELDAQRAEVRALREQVKGLEPKAEAWDEEARQLKRKTQQAVADIEALYQPCSTCGHAAHRPGLCEFGLADGECPCAAAPLVSPPPGEPTPPTKRVMVIGDDSKARLVEALSTAAEAPAETRCVCHSGSVCGPACAGGQHHDGCAKAETPCENECNPFIASCGARVCTMEDMVDHMDERHSAEPAPRSEP